MKWKKMGLIYKPNGEREWMQHSAMTPTPFLLDDETIRVYVGFRDSKGVSRIGYVDIKANNPSKILDVSYEPVLDIGFPGAFDDNGIILGDVIKYKNEIRMYYVGFQLVQKVKFLAFSGLAISKDGGYTFKRLSNAPILDRTDGELYIRAIHSVIIENGKFRVWYSAGNGWEYINGKPYPKYDIRYLESKDGITFKRGSGKVLIPNNNLEYRIGRPRVYRFNGKYYMFYTKGVKQGNYFGYLPGFAESEDGIHWVRRDNEIGIVPSTYGWDSEMLCYPALLTYRDKIYMFYNGNNMGKTGFGYAILESW